MLWVGSLLHIANVQLEECLGVEGVVFQEPKVGVELCDMVLDWGSAESPCVFGLHTAPVRSMIVHTSNHTNNLMVYMFDNSHA